MSCFWRVKFGGSLEGRGKKGAVRSVPTRVCGGVVAGKVVERSTSQRPVVLLGNEGVVELIFGRECVDKS
jgi:hypothetical protein